MGPGRPLAAEAIGAFVLVFGGCGVIAVGSLGDGATGPSVALAFGLAVGVMVYALGHISGAHLNPAVTLAFAATGRLPRAHVLPYWAAQVGGAIVASLLLRLTLGPDALLGVTRPAGGVGQAFAWEVVLTAMLMFVIAACATDARVAKGVSGVAIGGTVALGALVGGPISGASMNPARSIGPALVSLETGDLWIYLAAPLLGAVVAAIGYALIATAPGKPAGPVASDRSDR